MAKTPQEAVKILKEILALLAGAGFPISKTGSTEQQLSSSLQNFQRGNNLPVTGKLDQGTLQKLQEKGLAPTGNDNAVETVNAKPTTSTGKDVVVKNELPRPGFSLGTQRLGGGEAPVGTQKGRALETEQASSRVDSQRPDVEVDLKGMLQSLREAGFAGAGKGKEQLTDAVKKLQRADGLPPTGKLDAKTAESLEKRGVLDSATARALKEQDPTWSPPATTSTADDARLTKTDARHDPDARGAVDGQEAKGASSSNDDSAGVGGKGVDGGAGNGGNVNGDGRVDDGDDDGNSDDVGNTYAGNDDDSDDRRGLANRDDNAFEQAEYWQAPALRAQIDDAFAGLVRDDDGHGAATYGWQVVLHRPGVYAARQPADEILKLLVQQAGPFDPVWQQAIDALNTRLRRYEREAEHVTMSRLKQALQQARYRSLP